MPGSLMMGDLCVMGCVKLPRVFNQRTQTFTVSEIKALVTAASRRPETVASRLLMLLAFTGARLGEATNAKWQDIDLEKACGGCQPRSPAGPV